MNSYLFWVSNFDCVRELPSVCMWSITIAMLQSTNTDTKENSHFRNFIHVYLSWRGWLDVEERDEPKASRFQRKGTQKTALELDATGKDCNETSIYSYTWCVCVMLSAHAWLHLGCYCCYDHSILRWFLETFELQTKFSPVVVLLFVEWQSGTKCMHTWTHSPFSSHLGSKISVGY